MDFLKNGKISEDLENITVTIEDLAKQMPELKSFAEKTKGTKIIFSNNLNVNGRYIYQDNLIIINTKAYSKEVLPHELQHVIDIKEILSNPNDKELQAILEANEIVTKDMHNMYDNNFELIIKCNKMISQGNFTLEKFEQEFSEVEREILKSWYNEYYKDYLNDILEQRAFEAGRKGLPNGRTLKETIE